ncbi:sigma-70 family RNA polymerase sigma factor, partial [Amycolatopsis mediterranei]|uniref:sigma-70 family RNA polymerase sigma factor n=1 Tax=Amycolatopsis mediterranei TaxID=33910 RepID=UPI00331DC599
HQPPIPNPLPPPHPLPIPFAHSVCHRPRTKAAPARTPPPRQDEPVAELPDEPDSSLGPEHHALRRELRERMANLLGVLPRKQREIVVLRVVVGLSAEETAAAVGSTPGAVRVAQHRALGQLRKVVTSP